MLTFTERSREVLRLVLELTFSPDAALRIAPKEDVAEVSRPARLQIATTSDFDVRDELVIAPGGIPVLIAPAIAPMLENSTIDGCLTDGRPSLVVVRAHEHTI